MTTDTTLRRRDSGAGTLLKVTSACLGMAAAAVMVAALWGPEGAVGAVSLGAGLVLAVFVTGSAIVQAVTHHAAAASLLVALLTYTLQVVAMAVFFAVVSRSGLLEQAVDRQWLAATVVIGAVLWVGLQVVATLRRRIPTYDLPPSAAAPGSVAGGSR